MDVGILQGSRDVKALNIPLPRDLKGETFEPIVTPVFHGTRTKFGCHAQHFKNLF